MFGKVTLISCTHLRADGSVLTRFQRTPVMSTFIVAFHVSDFKPMVPTAMIGNTHFSGGVGRVCLSVWVVEECVGCAKVRGL